MKLWNVRSVTFAICLVLLATLNVLASGPAGVFAVVDKVVFEPSEKAPERIQLWGAFAFVAGGIKGAYAAEPQRGYLYFEIPAGASAAQRDTIRKEWNDFKATAGTGQGLAFGEWFYSGDFNSVNSRGLYGSGPNTVKVYAGTPNPSAVSVPYNVNTGIVKLAATGSHAETVRQLQNLLRK